MPTDLDSTSLSSLFAFCQDFCRPNHCPNLLASFTGTSVLHVVTSFNEAARKELRLLITFDDDFVEQEWKHISKRSTTA